MKNKPNLPEKKDSEDMRLTRRNMLAASLASLFVGAMYKLFNREARLSRMLEHSFSVVGGNSPIQEAQLVIIGDAHFRSYQKTVAELINLLAEDGDLVLVEGVGTNETIEKNEHSSSQTISPNVTVRGWENMALHKEQCELEIPPEVHPKQNGETHEEYIARLESRSHLIKKLKAEHERLTIERNAPMFEAVRELYPNYKHVFVIQGSNHLKDPRYTEQFQDKKFCVV
jgi:hypothetical protein